MMAPVICIADCNHGFFEPEIEESRRHGAKLIVLKNCDQHSLGEKARHADILIVQRLQVDSLVLDQLHSCTVVTRYGVGLDNVDCSEAVARGIKVVNFPTFCTEEVANHAIASIMFCYRQFDVIFNDPDGLQKKWGSPAHMKIDSAHYTTVGVLGAGRIGKMVVSRLLACGFNTIYHDPFLSRQELNFLSKQGAMHVDDFNSFLRQCSILTIHTPLTYITNGLLVHLLYG